MLSWDEANSFSFGDIQLFVTMTYIFRHILIHQYTHTSTNINGINDLMFFSVYGISVSCFSVYEWTTLQHILSFVFLFWDLAYFCQTDTGNPIISVIIFV